MKIKKIATAVIASVAFSAQASLVGMNLNHGAGGGSFAVDNFTSTHTDSPFGPFAGEYPMLQGEFTNMYAPSGNSGGGLMVTSVANSEHAVLLSNTPNDGRLYGSNAGDFSFNAYTLFTQASSAKLLVKQRGSSYGPSGSDGGATVTLNGADYDLRVVSTSSGTPGSAGDSITTYFWDNLSIGNHSVFNINYVGELTNKSFDAFAIVTNPSEVPVPAAAWLFGSAILGLKLARKK